MITTATELEAAKHSTKPALNLLSYTNCALDPTTGSGKTVWAYSEGMKQRGHSVDVAAPADFTAGQKWRGAQKFRQAYGALQHIKSQVARKRYDVIEFYGDEFWLATSWLAKQKSRPLLVAHTNGLELLRHVRAKESSEALGRQSALHRLFTTLTHERFSHIAFSKADAFAALCESDCNHVLKLGYYQPDRIAVVPPGLDEEFLDRPLNIPAQVSRVSFTGSWISRKGTDVVVKVMTQILQEFPHIHFDVFGNSGRTQLVLADFAEALHSRITVHPRIDNGELADRLSLCQVFLFPTRYEGFGIATAEAMACGNAVVTTATGYGADLKAGEEALICPFDDATAMTAAVRELINDTALRTKITQNGWNRSQTLRWKNALDVMEHHYLLWSQAR